MSDAYAVSFMLGTIDLYNALYKEYSIRVLNPNKAQWHCLIHVLQGTLVNVNRLSRGFVPMSSVFIKEHFGDVAACMELIDTGLLEFKDYSYTKRKSREFKACKELLDIYCEYSILGPVDKKQRVNLVTGKHTTRKYKSKLHDSLGNPEPKKIVEAIKCIKRCLFSLSGLQQHLATLQKEYEDAPDELSKRKALGRLYNDRHCANTVLIDCVSIEEDFYYYTPSYSVQMSGRITEQGGGMQSCTRVMKQLTFPLEQMLPEPLDNMYNYDLKSSQAYGLLQQLEDARIECEWLNQYLIEPNAKYVYAELLGVSVECWKDCLYMSFMGASLKTGNKEGSVVQRLETETGDLLEGLKLYNIYLTLIAPLAKSLKEWHNWLTNEYMRLRGYWVSTSKGTELFINNPTGKSLNISEMQESMGVSEIKRKLSAFLLQGFEAAFICRLTAHSAKFGYEVQNNQHDGLVTLGVVPQAAVDVASKEAGLKYPVLERKVFL